MYNKISPTQLCYKAEWEKVAEHMENVGKEISDNLNKLSINELWNYFKSRIESGTDKFIPQKFSSTNKALPWVTGSIKRLMK